MDRLFNVYLSVAGRLVLIEPISATDETEARKFAVKRRPHMAVDKVVEKDPPEPEPAGATESQTKDAEIEIEGYLAAMAGALKVAKATDARMGEILGDIKDANLKKASVESLVKLAGEASEIVVTVKAGIKLAEKVAKASKKAPSADAKAVLVARVARMVRSAVSAGKRATAVATESNVIFETASK